MTRDADIPTIFNPGGTGSRRVRAPSVVVTGDEALCSHLPANGPNQTSTPQIHHADSVTSSQQSQHDANEIPPVPSSGSDRNNSGRFHKIKNCTSSCCSKSARKIYFGVCVTVCVTASWVGATHCIKYLYFRHPALVHSYAHLTTMGANLSAVVAVVSTIPLRPTYTSTYNAPFFTTWFCTNWTFLFFPLYFLCRLITNRCRTPGDILTESIRNFRDRGFTIGRFLTRCSLFCLLWVATNYMYIHSLRILWATDVMALFATNVACVYLLSWVILHEQFVGVRIVAVILCDTGIALLAYMDGITDSPTLGGVVLAASAAAGSAVYKVLFKKVIGEATYGQVALFFSLIGLLNALLLWPLSLGLYFTGLETLQWERLPWPALLAASGLSLIANLLGNFGVALTYDLFITLGLITSVPVSAALDVVLYGTKFAGMKLAGMILIAVGFFLVMFPDNWPDYITRLLRWAIRPCLRPNKYHYQTHHPLQYPLLHNQPTHHSQHHSSASSSSGMSHTHKQH